MRRGLALRPAAARGMTLIELIIAMAIGASVLAVAAGVLSRTVAINSTAADRLQSLAALGQLGQQFRRDVHAALSATAGKNDMGRPALTMTTSAGSQIRYEADGGGITRVEETTGRPVRREAFSLADWWATEFRSDENLVTIVLARVTRRPDGEDVRGAQFELTAARARPATTRDAAAEAQP